MWRGPALSGVEGALAREQAAQALRSYELW
jgi:hypothetical protein